MSVVVIGVNHRTASLDLLERVSVADDAAAKAIASLTARANVREAVLLSTCNRTEVYAVAERFHGAYADIRDFFCELAGMGADELGPHLYSEHDEAAVAHLFAVASGLESAVLGESEILGQVSDAWELARREGGARSSLNLLFRHAVETGKRARTDTDIGRGTASVSHAAVEMATERLGTLQGARVLVVGAGDMGEGITVALDAAGASITVVNRSLERGTRLAERVGAAVRPWSDLVAALSDADVVLTCTGAGTVLIDAETLRHAQDAAVRPAELLVVDIAVPRDVAADVGDLAGVTLLNLDHLRAWAERGLARRSAEADAVRAIVADEVERFQVDTTARQAAPLVAELHDRAEAIRVAEMARQRKRLAGLSDDQLAAIDAVTKGIVAKLLHQPSVTLKDSAGTPQGDRNAAAVRDLFDLG